MTLTEIILSSASRMSNVTVDVARAWGTVRISDDMREQEDIFMQGDGAEEFIAQCDAVYEETGDVGMRSVELHVASPYVECLWN